MLPTSRPSPQAPKVRLADQLREALRRRRGCHRAVTAVGAKNARLAWVLLARGEPLRAPA